MNDRTSMLFKAIYAGDATLTEALLDEGVSPNSTRLSVSETAKPALWWAGSARQKEIFQLLLARGADAKRYSSDAEHAYPNLLSVTAWNTELSLDLIARGVDPYDFSPSGLNYMWYAACETNIDLMGQLASRGVEVDPDPMHGSLSGRHFQSIVHSAAQRFNPDLLDLAIELGGNPFTRNLVGMTALHSAAHHIVHQMPADNVFTSLLGRLLDYGLHIDSTDDAGNTALHYAVGHTPFGAKFAAQPEIIKHLLDAGADPKLRNKRGMRPVDVANKAGIKAIRDYPGPTLSQGA
jgi:ankyrin repeat protein